MEEYNNHMNDNSSSTTPRPGTFLYASPVLTAAAATYNRTSSAAAAASNNSHMGLTSFHHHHNNININPPKSATTTTTTTECFPSDNSAHQNHVKSEASTSKFHHYHPLFHAVDANDVDAIKAKIIAHPHYSTLLQAYIDCHKVGAPPEVVERLTAVRQELEARKRSSGREGAAASSCKDPELDQFMEAYYDMLVKYKEEVSRPIEEALEFMRRIEAQLNMLGGINAPLRIFNGGGATDEKCEGVGSSEEDQDNSGGETEVAEIDPRAEDRELKNHLLKKYSGYLSSLKQELSKKKKKGKLPKEARQKLLNWWELHYKWPYPSESEKVALAESTGLDQKQINNWFINQRKRHWKPSEDMQFMVMDGLHAQNAAALYMDTHFMGAHHDAPYRLGP